MKCLSITIERGNRPLYAQFGGISLKTESFKPWISKTNTSTEIESCPDAS